MGSELKPIREMKVATFDAGFRRFIDKLIQIGFKVKNVMPINNNRYCIVFGEEKNIMFLFKKEVFFNFGKMFRDQGFKGVGDTINSKDVQKAHHYNVKEFYICFPNAVVYQITFEDFMAQSVSWVNKEGKSVRSVSIHSYKRAFEI